MNEEKMYMVKNDEGKYWDFKDQGKFWELSSVFSPITNSNEQAELVADKMGGNVVTLIEEPEKVVLTKEQSEIVENARIIDIPATYISDRTDEHNGDKILGEEILLIKALTNGYTVEKDKKYGVWVPHVKGKMYYKDGRGSDNLDIASADCLNDKNQQFTLTEIEHYGLQDCDKVEVTDYEQ